MSLFGGFQDAWTKKFPGQNLPQAWEDDVRANLITHRRRVAVLKEELEKESFYVEYLERLLAEVEKHRNKSVVEPSSSVVEPPSEVGQVTAQNGRSHQMLLSSLGLSCSREQLENGEDEENVATSFNDNPGMFITTEDTLKDTAHDEFVTVIEVNGELNVGKGVKSTKLPSPSVDGGGDEDVKSQSSSSHSSPAVNKKKVPPKPPPKRSRPTLTYKGSFKVEEVSKEMLTQDTSLRGRIKSLPPGHLDEKSLKSTKNLTKSDSLKSSSSVEEYEELRQDDYQVDDSTLKSEASGHSSRSGLSGGGEVSPGAAGLDEDDDEFTSGAEENSPKYSDYVNIDYFLKKRARLRSVEERVGESEAGDDYSEDEDDDGMGLLLHTLVGNSTEDEEETAPQQEAALTVPADPPPVVVVAGTRAEEHDVLDGDSGVYSSSVESASFLCPSTPPTPPQGPKYTQPPAPPSNTGPTLPVATVTNGGDNYVVPVADGAEAERITMVKCIVNSILESETIYWECLNVLLQYMKALRSTLDTSQPMISREDLSVIFYKIPDLHGLHLSFLDGIKNSVLHSDGRLAIGDHFKILASRLGVYASYLQNYSHAIETVRKCSTENPKFSDITKSIKLQALKGQAVSLEDLLHKPVARVQKNALVLHDLLKYTSEFNPDYKALQVALRMTQCFLNEFNMSATESMFPSHDRTQRHLVKNSFIVELSEGRRKLRHLFLFNDVIVCAKYKVSGREKFTYEVKWYIPLHDVILPAEEGFVREINPVNLLSLKSQVASIRDLITKEELASKEKSWGSGRNLDKLRKRLAELQAQIMLASPNLVFRLGQKIGRNYYFFLSSKFERCQWIEAISAVQASAPQTTTTLTLYELQAWITACHRFLQTNMGSFLLKSGKEEELLVGDLNVIVNSMQELRKPSDIYLCLEVDSYGHFFRKAMTEVCRHTVEPQWNQEFVIDLEGSQMLRILCYEEVPGYEAIVRGKAAIELNKSWLTNQYQEKKISLQDCTLSLSLKFSQRDRTLSRVPSSKSCAVFGLKIGQVVKREKREIPFLISCCMREVEKRGMHELGVYRVSGPASELQRLKRAFETNPYDAEQMVKELDIHSVTGILKLYLRELPEGLFTDELYPKFLEAFSLVDVEAKSKTLLTLFNSLPTPNSVIVNYLMEHMIRIIKEEAHNKMSLQNVATVFGPTLLRPSVKSEAGNMSDKLAAGTIDVMAQAGILYFYLKKRAAGESLLMPTPPLLH